MSELSVAGPEEQKLCDEETFVEWGAKLTLEQYFDRQRRLRATAWERARGRDWILREGLVILASCTTYGLPYYEDRAAPPAEAIGVGNVFTPERFRGRGHATRLLQLLMKELEAARPALRAFFLFSDIDPKFYARLGFGPRPARDRVFAPIVGEDPAEGVETIALDDVGALDLSSKAFPPTVVLIPPTRESLDWQLERERIYANHLRRARPRFQGARAQGGEILWSADYKYEELVCVFLKGRPHLLVHAACRMAGELGLKQVRAWEEGPQIWPEGTEGGMRVPRPSSVPMIRVLGESRSAKNWAWVPRGIWV